MTRFIRNSLFYGTTAIFICFLFTINHSISENSLKEKNHWDYYPTENVKSDRPRYGIIMAGTKNKFLGTNKMMNMMSPCISKLYAMRHGYAFTIEKSLEDVHDRTYGPCKSFPQWNKIHLMKKYIDDVDVLIWIDLDAIITRFDTKLSDILPNSVAGSACLTHINATDFGTDVAMNKPADLPGAVDEPFFWTTVDVNPGYRVNVNTGVLALRRGSLASEFLDRVWKVGENPFFFQKYDTNYGQKVVCSSYYGWPWEQGGVWDVLRDRSDFRFIRATCVLPSEGEHAVNSIVDRYYDGAVSNDRPFILHKPVLPMFSTILDAAKVDKDTVREVCSEYGFEKFV